MNEEDPTEVNTIRKHERKASKLEGGRTTGVKSWTTVTTDPQTQEGAVKAQKEKEEADETEKTRKGKEEKQEDGQKEKTDGRHTKTKRVA